MTSENTLSVEWVPRERLFLNPANPRINDAAVPHVAASIRRFGWRQPIVAKPSGEVVAGNTRLKAAEHLGCERVPVVRFEGGDIEATAYAIARMSPVGSRTCEIATSSSLAITASRSAPSRLGSWRVVVDDPLVPTGQDRKPRLQVRAQDRVLRQRVGRRFPTECRQVPRRNVLLPLFATPDLDRRWPYVRTKPTTTPWIVAPSVRMSIAG